MPWILFDTSGTNLEIISELPLQVLLFLIFFGLLILVLISLVLGYPEGHSDCTSLEDDIKYLKDKVDAGADFVVTQLFYDVDIFISWVEKCRQAGMRRERKRWKSFKIFK